MFDENLARALNFIEEDVSANREGRMTVMQYAKLRHYIKDELKWSIVGIPFFVGLILLLGFSLSTGRGVVDFAAGVIYLLAFLAAVVLVRLVLSIRRGYLADLNEGRIKAVQGKVTINRTEDGSRILIPIEDGCIGFNISREAASVFREGEVYRIYYAPRCHYLLSAESVKVKS